MFIGVDIEDISRFNNKNLNNDALFLKRIFTQKELDYCFSKKNYAQSLTARFCAKEAVVKALNNLYNGVVSYNKIEILNYPNGEPYINVLLNELKKFDYSLSLSHEKDKAVAFVIVNKNGE